MIEISSIDGCGERASAPGKVKSVRVKELVARYPRVYHMAEQDAWPSIRDRGLLSTTATLDIMGVSGAQRFKIESMHRPEKVPISNGTTQIVLRDQKPMEPDRLAKALVAPVTTQQWYETINNKVFFWVREERLHGLLNARPYRDLEHDVLVIDTPSLVAAHEKEIWVCHMNSGNTFPFPHARDLSAFQRIDQYPTRSNGNPVKEVVELVVDYRVLDITEHVIEVNRMRGSNILGPISLR